MSKQTAVQWFVYKITVNHDKHFIDMYRAEIEEAMQIEREQIISNYCKGFEASAEGWNGEHGLKDMRNISEEIKAEKYYNETYGGQDEM